MQIGIAPNDEAVEKFNEFKFSHKLYYVIYKMAGDKEIVVDKVGENTKTFDDMKADLPTNEPRYIILNHSYAKDELTTAYKIFLILYTPTSTRLRQKMLYASAKSAVKAAFTGIQNELDVDESFRLEDVTEKATRV